MILLYSFTFNTIIILFPSCENTFDYSDIVCGSPICMYDIGLLDLWDVIIHDIIPTIIIIIFSLGLLVRIVHKKRSLHRPIHWRKHRKMTIQLLSISLLYLIIYMPKMLIEFAHICGAPEELGADFLLYAEFFEHFGNILIPFVFTGSLPEFQTRIRKLFPCFRRRMRGTRLETITMSRMTKVTPTQMHRK